VTVRVNGRAVNPKYWLQLRKCPPQICAGEHSPKKSSQDRGAKAREPECFRELHGAGAESGGAWPGGLCTGRAQELQKGRRRKTVASCQFVAILDGVGKVLPQIHVSTQLKGVLTAVVSGR